MDQGVGREIKRLREERGWSMARLAVEADMSVSGVSMIENGKRNLTTTTLAKLARAYGVEIADLFPKADRRSSLELSFEDVLEEERPASDDLGQGFSLFAKAIRDTADVWEVDVNIQDISDAEIAGEAQAIRDLYIYIARIIRPEDLSEPSGWGILTMREEDELEAVLDRLAHVRKAADARLKKSGYYDDGKVEELEQERNEIEERKLHNLRRRSA